MKYRFICFPFFLMLFSYFVPAQTTLENANSQYLQAHADNPVNWYQWSTEALELAKKNNQLVIISIGYSSCHWCHVMEQESFMDTMVAKYMNVNFVNIKVDREERPDIDKIYTEAAQMLTGNSGWPLNIIALPDGKPLFAGTYYDKEEWLQLLKQAHQMFTSAPERMQQNADAISRKLERNNRNTPISGIEQLPAYEQLWQYWQPYIDFNYGGFRQQEKFPLPVAWQSLSQFYYLNKNPEILKAITTTLDQMMYGGIYDQIGGGFFRYSTDQAWFEPHFEKMLYDQAQLIGLYADAYKFTKNPEYKNIIRQTVEWVNDYLAAPEGGFYASSNAVTEGENGIFYLWLYEDLKTLLPEDNFRLLQNYFQIKPGGNLRDSLNLLHRKVSDSSFVASQQLNLDNWLTLKSSMIANIKIEREKRIKPAIDQKIITSWNALMIRGLVRVYTALQDETCLQKALETAHFIENQLMNENGIIYHSMFENKTGTNGFLDDYAFTASAFIDLYQATFDKHWLDLALKITQNVITTFLNKNQPLFNYHAGNEALFMNTNDFQDDFMPSANSVMAEVLFLLGHLLANNAYLEKSRMMVSALANDILPGGPNYANWSALLGNMQYKPFEVAVVGKDAQKLASQMQHHYLPDVIFLGGNNENLPLLKNKRVVNKTMIYVCRNKECKIPVEDIEAALEQIK